jgi:epoxide hydrolase
MRVGISRRGAFLGAVSAFAAVSFGAFGASTAIVPFRYAAPEDTLADLKRRLHNTRLPDGETAADWSQGVPRQRLRALIDYWATQYDWRKTEALLNSYPQFRTKIDGLTIHFLHVRSPNADALPLIMTHGWPSTVLEFMKIIEPLTNPTEHGSRAADAFHLVLPSLPGFAFSDKPAERGWNMDRTARAWAVLMNRLGYRHYVAQGGDWGSFVTTRLAQQKPSGLAAIHLTMPQVMPDELPAPLSKEEQRAVDRVKHWKEKNFGYFLEQATRPQTIGYGLADSPSGLAAWIYDIYGHHAAEDATINNDVPLDDMLNEIMLYWLTNSAASSAKFYFEQRALGLTPNLGRVDLPVGCTIFPHDLHAPRSWAEKMFPNLTYWSEPDRGGHFAPLEVPAMFVQEMRNCFRAQRPS